MYLICYHIFSFLIPATELLCSCSNQLHPLPVDTIIFFKEGLFPVSKGLCSCGYANRHASTQVLAKPVSVNQACTDSQPPAAWFKLIDLPVHSAEIKASFIFICASYVMSNYQNTCSLFLVFFCYANITVSTAKHKAVHHRRMKLRLSTLLLSAMQ